MGAIGNNVAVLPKDTVGNAELGEQFYNETGIRLGNRMTEALDTTVFASTVEHVRNLVDNPTIRDLVQQLGTIELGGRSNALAATNGTTLKINNAFMGDHQTLDIVYQESVRTGYHPEGTTWENIVDHEMGHVITMGILQRVHGGNAAAARADWNDSSNRSTMGSIVNQAVKQIRDNYQQYGYSSRPSVSELKRDISGYATKNHHETIAEAFADRSANGNKAKPLSREIYKILMSYGRERG